MYEELIERLKKELCVTCCSKALTEIQEILIEEGKWGNEE